MLVAANLIPVLGVLFFGWSIFEIVSLYWFENVVIGVFNVIRIFLCKPDSKALGNKSFASTTAKFFLIPFFSFHYGMFCLVHGFFVIGLLGGKGGGNDSSSGVFGMVAGIFQSSGKWFVFSIIASHLFSLIVNYIGKGEYRRVTPDQLMASPYGRIVVLHIAIIFGAFAIAALGSPVGLLLLLIAGKIILDAGLHLRSHRKLEPKTSPPKI